MQIRPQAKAVFPIILVLVALAVLVTTIHTVSNTVKSVSVMGWFGISTEIPIDAIKEEYMGSVELAVNPSCWSRFIRLQRIEYGDPRFTVVNCWVIERGGGIEPAEDVDLASYGARPLRGENLVGGSRRTLLHLRRADHYADITLPADFRPTIKVYYTFLGREYMVSKK